MVKALALLAGGLVAFVFGVVGDQVSGDEDPTMAHSVATGAAFAVATTLLLLLITWWSERTDDTGSVPT